MSPPKPENQASRCSLVEPVLPAMASRLSTLARTPVPRWTTSRIIDTIWDATRATIARGASSASAAGTVVAEDRCLRRDTARSTGAGPDGPMSEPATQFDPLLPLAVRADVDSAQSGRATAGSAANSTLPSRSRTSSTYQGVTWKPPLGKVAYAPATISGGSDAVPSDIDRFGGSMSLSMPKCSM